MLTPFSRICKLLLIVCLLSSIGCGGGSSSTGAWTSSLERGKLISTISSAERSQVCQEFTDWWMRRSTKVELCTFAGVLLTTLLPIAFDETPQPDVQACNDIVNECVPQQGEGDSQVDCVLNDVEKLQSCGATVDEMDACLDDSLQIIRQVVSSLSCDIAGNFEAVKAQFESVANVPPSLACESLKVKCPDVFRETEVSEPT
ncbi:MAG: hypothetical protein K1X79_14335 [Oligoflexia bacterium]|nr:hypothetical protein [Oligoflexia bacterium]